MTRKLITLMAIAATLSGVAAPATLDPGSVARLRSLRSGYTAMKQPDGTHRLRRTPAAPATVGAFVTITPGYTAADLEAEGYTLTPTRGDFYLTRIPLAEVEAFADLPAVASVRVERELSTKMNLVRDVTDVDLLHSGHIDDMEFTGAGVLCAIVDEGFDPNHLNFRNPDGSSRIQNFTYFRPTQAGTLAVENHGPEYMPEIDTESSRTFHGTHTLGIMAGSYYGNLTTSYLDWSAASASDLVKIEEMENPYYGVAPDADLAVACGCTTDYSIALGIEEILNFASRRQTELGRPYPVVINISMGSNLGPHDGSGKLAQYFDAVCDEGYTNNVICVAAGNEGDKMIAAHKTFTADDTSLQIGLTSYNVDPVEYPNALGGPVYIYSDSDTPFELQAIVYNRERGTVVFRAIAPANPEGSVMYYVTDNGYKESDDDVVSKQLAQYFSGYIGVTGMLDTGESGRYLGIVDPMLWETSANKGKYVLVLQVTGEAGQRIDLFCDGTFYEFGDNGMADKGVIGGTADGTISDTATGFNTISVGSTDNRLEWASLDGKRYSVQNGEAPSSELSSYSSWGTLVDGRRLPVVCAPGCGVISSTNEYYLQDNRVGLDELQATVEANGRRYSWQVAHGTSMSTPVVSGIIALWKEADPTLSYKDIREIIELTANTTGKEKDSKENEVKWGAGLIDAHFGMMEVLLRKQIDGIADITAEPGSEMLLTAQPDGYHIVVPGARAVEGRLYSPAGVLVATVSSEENQAVISTAGLEKGIYLLNVNGVHTRKIAIR
ncbi:MAG: S8 family peptidase [Muribaculaceae bacterium]|nr:S8 family peptidase [Muribaculaceae bacterium]